MRYTTQIDLDETTREQLVEQLNTVLATTIDLTYQVKQAHWNLRGPWFFARHELFDDLADHLRAFGDDVAERAGALGGYAEGTTRLANENSALGEYDRDAVDGAEHLTVLVARYREFTRLLRTSVELAGDELDDPATEDLFIEGLRQAEMDLWFLQSHLEKGLTSATETTAQTSQRPAQAK